MKFKSRGKGGARGGRRRRGGGGGLAVFCLHCSPPLLLLSLTAAPAQNSTERARTPLSHARAASQPDRQTDNSLFGALASQGSVGLEEKRCASLQCLGREHLL